MYLAKPNRKNVLNKEEILLYEMFELAMNMNTTSLIEVHITPYLDEIHHNSNIFKGNIS